MSWIQKLYETYEACHALDEDPKARPWPISHFVKQAHIEVVLDGDGNFRAGRTRKLAWNEAATLIPATEKSAGRTAGVAPHPLCEEIGYIAIDLPQQAHLTYIKGYFHALEDFCNSVPAKSFTKSHAKLKELTLSYKQWLGMAESASTAEDSELDDDAEDEKTPKVADLEKVLSRLSTDGQLPDYLKTAPDFLNKQNLQFAKKNVEYFRLLEEWCSSSSQHPKAMTVLRYLNKGCLWDDLSGEGVFPLTTTNSSGVKTKIDDDKVFVRWRVETLGEDASATWDDQTLIAAWAHFDAAKNSLPGFCGVTGERTRLAQNHPRFLRYPGDGAKIISANDFSGLTFKGRFTDHKADYEKQVCSVGFDVSQKAHNALRWLIARQGTSGLISELAVVSWTISGQPVPDPCASSLDLFSDEPAVTATMVVGVSDSGQSFSLRLKRAIAGYSAKLDPGADIVVMGIDSATPGRMGISFYRELKCSEFLDRIEAWHAKCAWPQYFGKDRKFVGAPSPRDIAIAAYGRWDDVLKKAVIDEKLLKSAVARLLPCIVDEQALPRDLVMSVFQRAINRISFKQSEAGYEDLWEKCMGIACALIKGFHKERNYQMELEKDRMTRDYLYGRLLAIADSIESYALRLTEEGKKRDTTAARYMQRFAARPFSTWINIELALSPYMARLKAGSDKSARFLVKRKKLLDEVTAELNNSPERTSDAPLTSEFLLGFHTQRQSFRSKGEMIESEEQPNEETVVA